MTPASAHAFDPAAAGPRPEQRFSSREAARILDVPEWRLRALARAGLLAPQRGPLGPITFGFRELLLLRTTKGLLESGVSMRRIRHIWSSLREQLADDVPLTSVTIRADGEKVVASDGRSAWQADSGQFLLDFEAAELVERAKAVSTSAALPPAAPADAPDEDRDAVAPGAGAPARPGGPRPEASPPASPGAEPGPEQWLEAALELEASSPAEAILAYQRLLERDPSNADARVNLGRLYHLAGERGRAEAQYRDAVRLAPDDPVPHYNLGVLLEEQGRRDEAAHAYGQAVSRDPDFADAHCNLGLLLESVGRRSEAMRHLMAARELYRAAD